MGAKSHQRHLLWWERPGVAALHHLQRKAVTSRFSPEEGALLSAPPSFSMEAPGLHRRRNGTCKSASTSSVTGVGPVGSHAPPFGIAPLRLRPSYSSVGTCISQL